MKKLLVILLLAISTISFAQTGKASASATQVALDESNKLLQQALDRINALEKEKETAAPSQNFSSDFAAQAECRQDLLQAAGQEVLTDGTAGRNFICPVLAGSPLTTAPPEDSAI